MHRSLAFTLSAWYAALLSGVFALVGTAMYLGMEQYLRANLRDTLARRTEQVQIILTTTPGPAPSAALSAAFETQIAPEFNNRFLRITSWTDKAVYQSGPPNDDSFDPAAVAKLPSWPQAFTTRRSIVGGRTALLIASLPVHTATGTYLIELGASLESIEAVQHRLLALLAMLLPVLVALAAGGAYLLVGRALRPVDEMSQTAENISIRNLDASLPVPRTGDAIQRLAVALNHMLTRLRESVHTSQRFLADASHELRTPLTIVKCELEEIVANPQGGENTTDRIGSVLEEVDRLKSLVEGLLVLSRLDAGEALREFVAVDLGELVASTAEQMRLLAEDGGVTLQISTQPSLTVQGDRARLKQVVVNLLDNAIKYTQRGGTVSLTAYRSAHRGILEVSDTGPGIAAAALPHVFDRFYRADESRTRHGTSVGLGLSIVRSICIAHAASVDVESTPGSGSCFRVSLPLAELAPPAALPAPSADVGRPSPPTPRPPEEAP